MAGLQSRKSRAWRDSMMFQEILQNGRLMFVWSEKDSFETHAIVTGTIMDVIVVVLMSS